ELCQRCCWKLASAKCHVHFGGEGGPHYIKEQLVYRSSLYLLVYCKEYPKSIFTRQWSPYLWFTQIVKFHM
ncbi:hypothetical protein MTR67_033053, partial [Solanum verrucosum]